MTTKREQRMPARAPELRPDPPDDGGGGGGSSCAVTMSGMTGLKVEAEMSVGPLPSVTTAVMVADGRVITWVSTTFCWIRVINPERFDVVAMTGVRC